MVRLVSPLVVDGEGAPRVFPHVLVVTGATDCRPVLTAGLATEGFVVEAARADELTVALSDLDPVLVVVEAHGEGPASLDACRTIRGLSTVPLTFVADAHSEHEAVLALELGADDYVVRPGCRELAARIRAVLRRAYGPQPAPAASLRPVLEVHGVRLNGNNHEVIVDGQSAALTLREFRVLEHLMSRAGRVVPRHQLLDALFSGRRGERADANLDTHVQRLRRKIERPPFTPHRIITVRGVGFRFEAACMNCPNTD